MKHRPLITFEKDHDMTLFFACCFKIGLRKFSQPISVFSPFGSDAFSDRAPVSLPAHSHLVSKAQWSVPCRRIVVAKHSDGSLVTDNSRKTNVDETLTK